MKHCQTLARSAGQTGNAPVGSVLVNNGIVVGEGQEAAYPAGDVTRHAEVEAIRDAVQRTGLSDFSGFTLYTTHEPCILCSYVIRHHRIGTIVFGLAVPAVGGLSSPYPVLTASDVPVWGDPPTVWQWVTPAE